MHYLTYLSVVLIFKPGQFSGKTVRTVHDNTPVELFSERTCVEILNPTKYLKTSEVKTVNDTQTPNEVTCRPPYRLRNDLAHFVVMMDNAETDSSSAS